jgi:hypothetical protein
MGRRRPLHTDMIMHTEVTDDHETDEHQPSLERAHPVAQPRAAIQQVAPRPAWVSASLGDGKCDVAPRAPASRI